MDSKGGYPHPHQQPPPYGFDTQPTHGAYIPPQTVYVEQPQTVFVEQPQGNAQVMIR